MKATSGSKPNIRLALLPLLSMVGTGAAVYLSKHYYDLRNGTAGFKSLCNINATMNCDAVTSSRYAEILPGLPLSSLVAGWFVALLIFGLLARIDDWRKESVFVGAMMAGIGSLYSIALLVVMTVVLHKFCLFCLIIDGVNFALFATYLSLLRRDAGGSIFAGMRAGKFRTAALIVAGGLFIMVVILRPTAENAANAPTSAEIRYSVDQILARAPSEIRTPESAAIMGAAGAPITIHEFSDFQCPFCKRGAVLMNQILARYEGKVRIIFMPFPLDQSCNRMITRPMHEYACELARSAYCASRSGKFQPVYEKFFEDQEFLASGSATKIPDSLGVPAEATRECIASEAAKQAVSLSIEEGIKLKVDSTPTFFINGRKVDGGLPIEAWDRLIEAHLTASP